MTLIIDIRGTHGSGKSYIPKTLLYEAKESSSAERIVSPATMLDREKHLGWHIRTDPDGPLVGILGDYTEFGGGGCDGISPVREIERRLESFILTCDVVLIEGILVAHTFKRWNKMADTLRSRGHRYIFIHLQTPKDECIASVRQRRELKGEDPEFSTLNLESDFVQIARTCDNLREAGQDVRSLTREQAMQVVRIACSGEAV